MAKQDLCERIQKGESAIAQARADGRDVADWERHLETMKLEAVRLFPGNSQNKGISCNVDEGKILAVLIDSTVLGAPIWFALRDSWQPDSGDSTPVFYASELPMLRTKTLDQLRAIYKVKAAFGVGSRVRQ